MKLIKGVLYMKKSKLLMFLSSIFALTLTGCNLLTPGSNTESQSSGHTHHAGDPVREHVVEATCEEDGHYETVVYCTECHEELSREIINIPATGHDWNKPEYTWSDNYSYCLAETVCRNDSDHVLKEEARSIYEIIVYPQVGVEGQGRYTATFNSSVFEEQTRFVTIPALPDEEMPEFGDYVTYGYYPQSLVTDVTIIDVLETLDSSDANGWYDYNNEYYVPVVVEKVSSNPYFANGTKIVIGNKYWFHVEPIQWRILDGNDELFTTVSKYILDGHGYNSTNDVREIDGEIVYGNNYAHSDIRQWLNEEFYEAAFYAGGSRVKTTLVDNSPSSTGFVENAYACEDTSDKIYLLSRKELLDPNNGFSSEAGISGTREAFVTDYARAKGAYANADGNGSYWTRSPATSTPVDVWRVDFEGTFYLPGSNYKSFQSILSVRPAMTVLR